MTWRDWLKLVLLFAAFEAIQFGIWYWGYSASTSVPFDRKHSELTMLLCLLITVIWARGMYTATVLLRRARANSRLLGLIALVAMLLPTVVLAVVARLGGPRFTALMLQFPMAACSLGLNLGRLRQQSHK